MRETEDWYEILHVHHAADPKALERAYKRLARRYHPDVNTASDATEAMQRLNDAYAVLSDPDRRGAYDRLQRRQASAGPEREEEQSGAGSEKWEDTAYAQSWMLDRLAAMLLVVVLFAMSGAGRLMQHVVGATWAAASEWVSGAPSEGAPALIGRDRESGDPASRAGRGSDVALATLQDSYDSGSVATYRRLVAEVRAWGEGIFDRDLDAGPGSAVDLACGTCAAIDDETFVRHVAALRRAADDIDPNLLSIDRFGSPSFDLAVVTSVSVGEARPWVVQVFERRRAYGAWRAIYGRTLGRGAYGPSATVDGFVAGTDGLVQVSVLPCGGQAIGCEALMDLDARTIRVPDVDYDSRATPSRRRD